MQRRTAIGIGAAVAVLAAGGGVAVLTLSSEPEETAAAQGQDQVTVLPPDPNAEPPRIPTELNTVDIAGTGGSAEVPQRDTKRFSLLGVTWSDPKVRPEGTIEVRTRSVRTGKWSGWQALERSDIGPDGSEAAASGRRGGTEPLWAGPSDGVAARIAGSGSGLPAGLRLDLIDPGSEPGGRGGGEPAPSASASAPEPEPSTGTPASSAPVVVPSVAPETPAPSQPTSTPSVVPPPPASSAPVPSAPASTKPTSAPATVVPTSTVPVKAQFPAYTSRAAWSADERIVGPIEVGREVKLLWVHHTATTNSYECAESPAIVRSIQAYHVKSNKWSDIGYNYLLDKCGRLFEGRKGGVETPVVGAHTQGFNTNYAAVSVIGNYESAKSNSAIEMMIAQLAAARLGKYNYNPTSAVTVLAGSTNDKYKAGTRITLPRVSGHRDGDATACPGANLYSRLAAIRAASQQMITGLALRSVTGGGSYGGAWYVKNRAQITWTLSTPAAQVRAIYVQVDGKTVQTLPGTARTAAVPLAPGKHSVVIRPMHVSGSSAVLVTTIYGDLTAPSTPSRLEVGLRTGTVSKSAVPVTFSFAAADGIRLGGYTISRPRAGSAASGSWPTTVRLGSSTYTVTARDVAGNLSRPASVSRSVLLSAEGSAKKTGSWTTRKGNGYLGDKALSASGKNRKLTWKFTGRSAALLFTRSSGSGKVAIYVDGKKVSTVDLKSKKTLHRQAVWTRNLAYGKHTVAIVVLGTSGRPTVISDGLAYVR